jgi:hypothetical protein
LDDAPASLPPHALVIASGSGPPPTTGHVGQKYRKLLRTICVEGDQQTYGDYYDYGYSATPAWRGHNDLPFGYWVYVAPNWHIFGEMPPPPVVPMTVVVPAPATVDPFAVAPVKRPYGPEQACGPPDTPNAGDLPTAWASKTSSGQDEWLRLHYAEAVTPSAIHVYETCCPGALARITARKPSGEEVELWSGQDPVSRDSPMGVAKIGVRADFATDCITLYLKSAEVPGWNEIDAVGVLDRMEKVHWAVTAEASSTYADYSSPPRVVSVPPVTVLDSDHARIANLELQVAELQRRMNQLQSQPLRSQKRSWGVEQACGPPDTPFAGDCTTAWASRTQDGQDEWLRLHYGRAVVPAEVHVYETYNPGALCRITARKPGGEEVEIWSGSDPVGRNVGAGLARIAVQCDFPTDCITIHLKSTQVPGWNEIDAVALVAKDCGVQWASSAEASSDYAELQPMMIESYGTYGLER